jgi:hydroxymethylpyrimidine/phosphomethylpyrimidine kinase
MQNPPRILIVAGSDSGGGAGIQGDIKTVTALGAYAMAAITAVTVQDTTGVHGFHPVPPEIVAQQISSVMEDIGADAIKTGMLVSASVVHAVARALAPYDSIPLVVDTVMIAKGGAALLDERGIEAMKQSLFPLAALITPNAPEAARLTGIPIASTDDMAAAGALLRKSGARAVLVKGGHLDGGTVTDVLVDATGVYRFSGPRIENAATHGTGCALASAIATGLGQGLPLKDAVVRAREFVQQGIRTGLALGQGTGPINHLHALGR